MYALYPLPVNDQCTIHQIPFIAGTWRLYLQRLTETANQPSQPAFFSFVSCLRLSVSLSVHLLLLFPVHHHHVSQFLLVTRRALFLSLLQQFILPARADEEQTHSVHFAKAPTDRYKFCMAPPLSSRRIHSHHQHQNNQPSNQSTEPSPAFYTATNKETAEAGVAVGDQKTST